MSIQSKLTAHAKRLVIARTADEKAKIDRSIETLQRNIQAHLGDQVSQMFAFGSYTRNTILPRKYDRNSDVDLMVIFNTENRELNPQTYRKKLHTVVDSAYPRSYSKKDAPAIKLELNHIKFDLVPAILEPASFWRRERLYVPDGADWVETSPNDMNQALSDANQKYGDNLVRHVVRLCKCWNAGAGHPLKSYFMEKEIVGLNFRREDTYSGFLYALEQVAGEYAGVAQALEWIREYDEREDEAKQLQWLQKLLPGL